VSWIEGLIACGATALGAVRLKVATESELSQLVLLSIFFRAIVILTSELGGHGNSLGHHSGFRQIRDTAPFAESNSWSFVPVWQ